MNSVNLIGRLTADPEIRYFESGKSIAKFSLAVNRSKDEADFFELEAWEKTAEIASQYCKKGSKIGVTGSLHQERWQDSTSGANRSKVVVRCSRVDLLDSRTDEQSVAPAPTIPATIPATPPPPPPRVTTAPANAKAAVAADYDDIPF
jgi:single-strand DNA-binding protein